MASYDKGELSSSADDMINRIVACVQEQMKTCPRVESATVTKVNEDGTVSVSLPAEGGVFSGIKNQSIYQDLQVGDSVEILLKNGSYSNCWIIGKHNGGKVSI